MNIRAPRISFTTGSFSARQVRSALSLFGSIPAFCSQTLCRMVVDVVHSSTLDGCRALRLNFAFRTAPFLTAWPVIDPRWNNSTMNPTIHLRCDLARERRQAGLPIFEPWWRAGAFHGFRRQPARFYCASAHSVLTYAGVGILAPVLSTLTLSSPTFPGNMTGDSRRLRMGSSVLFPLSTPQVPLSCHLLPVRDLA